MHVNIHRVKEGARVLEDVARFILKDESLFKNIKELRHNLISDHIVDVESDIGGAAYNENNIHNSLIKVIQANAARMQEALRVLEELSENENEKCKIKNLRFSSYRLQQEIYKKTLSYLKQDKLKGLYLIIDTDLIKLPLEEIVSVINQTAVNLVQLRNKSLSKRNFLQQAITFKKILHPDKLLIINDHLDIALDIADGVHLGQEDYPLERARKLSPEHFIIGATCHNIAEAKTAVDCRASYLSIGCIFPTQSKKDTTPTSLSELKKITQSTQIPICAIGGINSQNVDKVLECNVNMVAVLSAVWEHEDPATVINFLSRLAPNSHASAVQP